MTKLPQKKEQENHWVRNDDTGSHNQGYVVGFNSALDQDTKAIVERLEKFIKGIPPRDGQKKNVLMLLQNWKESIAIIEALISELRGRL